MRPESQPPAVPAVAWRVRWVTLLLLPLVAPVAADGAAHNVTVKRIWDAGVHNAFTDLIA